MIITNKHERGILYRSDVPEDVLEDQFDYLPDEEWGFIRYKGSWYHLSEFMRMNDPYWEGVCMTSNTSSTLIKVCGDGDAVIMGYHVMD